MLRWVVLVLMTLLARGRSRGGSVLATAAVITAAAAAAGGGGGFAAGFVSPALALLRQGQISRSISAYVVQAGDVRNSCKYNGMVLHLSACFLKGLIWRG
jgi:hypothetical protein